ncbi:MAG: hypothetical protein U0Q16_00330 [Bryobacteraceae bacterium]
MRTSISNAGIREAQRAMSSYYLLGYYSSNANPDGKFRRVKVTLADGRAAASNQGCYAPGVRRFTATDKERHLEDALMLAESGNEMTSAVEVGYFSNRQYLFR